jgi:hypothetical protein
LVAQNTDYLLFKKDKMRILYTLIILFSCMLSSVQMNAQEQRFKAGAILGFNMSQLDGDRSAGYNKLGIVGGLSLVILLAEKIDVNVELLYSQRGSRSSLVPDNSIVPFKISTDFIEIPVLFNYKDWQSDDGEYYKFHFHGGFSYGRLVRTAVDDDSPVSNLSQASEQFNKNDVSFILGATFYTGPHLAFTFRWSRSIGVLYFNDFNNINLPSLQNHLISFRALYMF